MRKRLTAAALCLLCLLGLMIMPGRMQVMADEVDYFTGEVSLLKELEDSYMFQIDVGNTGADFEGLVRLRFTGMSSEACCSYEQQISLPSGGQKQYKLTIPASNIEQTRGSGKIVFVNQKGKILQEIAFKDVLGGKMSGIQVGILSDDYDSLTYLDLGGEVYSVGNTEKPIRLKKLEKDQVDEALDALYFLVIDHYDTSALSAETVKSIEKWVDAGGCLLLGTGAYAEQTLAGMDLDFLCVSPGKTSQPGEENSASLVGHTGSYYYAFTDAGIDFSQMAVTELAITGQGGFEAQEFPAVIVPRGKGCAAVSSISFGDQEMQKAVGNSNVARNIYDGIAYSSASSLTTMDSDWSYWGQNAFGVIDHKYTSVNFTFPKILMLIYVILVGPILYLLLRVAKKREMYWIFVPALAMVFVGILFIYGQTVKINRTSLYSVTVQEAAGTGEKDMETYFSGYHSGVKPWSVTLSDDYTYGGAGLNIYGSGGSTEKDHYFINYGSGISIGMNPASNFETGFLYAAGRRAGAGSIETEKLALGDAGISGTITNRTAYDFPYIYLRQEDFAMIIQGFQSGETIDLSQITKSKRVIYETSYADDFYYEVVQRNGRNDKAEDLDLKAALFIGANAANKHRDKDQVLVCGVVPDYGKTVSGKCSEISYGCFYVTAEQEGSHAAN